MKLFRFRLPWRRHDVIQTDVDTELRFHLDSRTEELVASGLTPADARRAAEREFGDVNDTRNYLNAVDRDAEARRRRRDYMDDLRQDITYALRTLRRSPGFTLAAVITLALGIGANTAIFSVVNGVLLRDLPFPEPDRLVAIWLQNPATNARRTAVSAVDMDDWQLRQKAFTGVAAYYYAEGQSGTDLTGAGEPERVSMAAVSPGFFEVLGIAPEQGRLPRPDEMVRGGPDKVVMLSRGFWQRRFGGDQSIVNSTITLGGTPYRVLGVMPDSFAFPDRRAQLWIPFSTVPDRSIPRIREVGSMRAFGRIKDGVSLQQAQQDLSSVAAAIAREYPQSNRNWGAVTLSPLDESITGSVQRSLYVLLGAVALLMLMACVNVASLLLARASVRQREIGVRLALGAGRGRVLRQLLTESLVLALAGGVAGILLARVGLSGLLALSAQQLPRGDEVQLDATVLAFAIALSLITGILFGIVPARRAAGQALQGTLREGGRGNVSGGNRLRNGLVVAQVALAAMLIVGAGLMTKSFFRLLDVDRGFSSDRLVAVMFSISGERHSNYPDLQKRYVDLARTLPGVVDAAAARDAPFRGMGEGWSFLPEGMTLGVGESRPSAQAMFISDGYVRTLGGRMVEGREFTSDDRPPTPAGSAATQPAGTLERPVPALVNETLARRHFPDGAVGKTMQVGSGYMRVIGVVADIRQGSIEVAPPPFIFVPNQFQSRVKTTLLARVRGDPMTAGRAIRDAIWSVDRDQTITSIFTVDEAASDVVARPRLLTVLLGAFGVLGLALGALGIYGVLAYLVSQRRREIGVRLALGSDPGTVVRMIVGRGLALAGVGVAIGLAGALALGRFLSGVLYDVKPADPLTLATMTAVLLITAALAAWIPARRGSRVDPAVALRAE